MTRQISLSQGAAVALVDDDDYDRVCEFLPWQVALCAGKRYARKDYRDQLGLRRIAYMHTFLTGFRLVDHINGDGLDNRRANLRPASTGENTHNRGANQGKKSTPYKGVFFHRQSGLWHARIGVHGKTISLRYHHSPEEAARAYDDAARAYHGEFAYLNFPQEIAS